MSFLLVVQAVIAGALFPTQAAVNALLTRSLGHPMWAAFVSVVVTTVAIMIALAAIRPEWPVWAQARTVPWWMWVGGGLMGGYGLFTMLFLAPKLGAVTLTAALIAGQLSSSAVIDHYGWFGLAERELSLGRIAGIILLIAGVVLVRRF